MNDFNQTQENEQENQNAGPKIEEVD